MIAEGTYSNLSSEAYHADKASISRSGLMDFDKSPFHYWAKHINPNRPESQPTAPMILGSAIHTFILELHLFAKKYACYPEKVVLKHSDRETYDRYKKACELIDMSGKIVLTDSDYETLQDIQMKFHENEKATELLAGAEIEKSFFWKDPDTNLMLKCRPDILSRNYVADLKSCADASPRAFQNSIVAGGYHLQCAIIQEGIHRLENRWIDNFIFITIETKYPYAMGIYVLDEFALEAGRQKLNGLKNAIAQALNDDQWPDHGVQTISLPKWAL